MKLPDTNAGRLAWLQIAGKLEVTMIAHCNDLLKTDDPSLPSALKDLKILRANIAHVRAELKAVE